MLDRIDHTLLKPTVTKAEIQQACVDVVNYGFRGVCIPSCFVKEIRKCLPEDKKLSTVIGFPLGYSSTACKIAEVRESLHDGADELDIVWNIALFKSGQYLRVLEELSKLVDISFDVKIIVETCYLTAEECETAYQIVKDSGAFCIKTSTGYGNKGAEVDIVKLWKSLNEKTGSNLNIKASGGIKTEQDCRTMIEAGADIIGTSNGVNIAKEYYDWC